MKVTIWKLIIKAVGGYQPYFHYQSDLVSLAPLPECRYRDGRIYIYFSEGKFLYSFKALMNEVACYLLAEQLIGINTYQAMLRGEIKIDNTYLRIYACEQSHIWQPHNLTKINNQTHEATIA